MYLAKSGDLSWDESRLGKYRVGVVMKEVQLTRRVTTERANKQNGFHPLAVRPALALLNPSQRVIADGANQ